MVFSIIVIVLPIQGSSTLLRDVKLCVCAVLLSILALEVRHTDLRDLQLPQARASIQHSSDFGCSSCFSGVDSTHKNSQTALMVCRGGLKGSTSS